MKEINQRLNHIMLRIKKHRKILDELKTVSDNKEAEAFYKAKLNRDLHEQRILINIVEEFYKIST